MIGELLERETKERRDMGGGGFLKTLLGVIVLASFVGFLVVGVLINEENKPTRRNSKCLEVIGKDRHDDVVVHPAGLDTNSMSKRKVPNGPDPIHNRRAGNSRRPPGQA